jgi:transposase
MKISTIGLDLAKSVFAIHGIDEEGHVMVKRTLRRAQVLPFFAKLEHCLVGMEASSGAHYWARELKKLGHEVRLMPASYVKAYVKRGKTDGVDSEAVCEAVRRPTMRFVPVKSIEQQGVMSLHRARDLLVRQRTQTTNVLRALCAEFGIVAAKGNAPLKTLAAIIADDSDNRLVCEARLALKPLLDQLDRLGRNIASIEREIVSRHRTEEASVRLATVPGIGPLTASALIAAIGDPARFKSGRDLSAWIGLTPQPHSSGGKHRLGGISKQGDAYLRRLLVQGAQSVLYAARRQGPRASPWLLALMARRPVKVAAIALANRMARIAWAVLVRGGVYRAPKLACAVMP